MTAAKKYPAERLMNVVLAPVVSEKSTFVADKNRQYVFRVADGATRSEEHTSELQSRRDLVCRLLLEQYDHPPDPHSFPTRRSSDLLTKAAVAKLEQMLK